MPTPAVAYLTGALGADFGVMLSASHNPAPDNGIKLFARGGLKLPDAVEDEIETHLAAMPGKPARTATCPPGSAGSPTPPTSPSAIWSTCSPPGYPAAGNGAAARRWPATVVVDCAHGAASGVAPRLLRRAGAEVITIGAEPDGRQHQCWLRLDPPGDALSAAVPSTAPMPGSLTTATPTGAWRSAPRAG